MRLSLKMRISRAIYPTSHTNSMLTDNRTRKPNSRLVVNNVKPRRKSNLIIIIIRTRINIQLKSLSKWSPSWISFAITQRDTLSLIHDFPLGFSLVKQTRKLHTWLLAQKKNNFNALIRHEKALRNHQSLLIVPLFVYNFGTIYYKQINTHDLTFASVSNWNIIKLKWLKFMFW